MNIFVEVLIPVLMIYALGFILQKTKRVQISAISTLTIYILIPSLVFVTFYDFQIAGREIVLIAIFALVMLVILIIVNKIFARIRGYNKSEESGLILSTCFMNIGNYGAPIVLFAFGETAFAYAVSYFVLQTISNHIMGIYYASRGQYATWAAIKQVLKMPLIYTLFAAIILRMLDIQIYDGLFNSVDLMSKAAIPAIMLVLGMQLAELKLEKLEWDKISFGIVMRLIISPLFAYGLVLMLGINDLLGKVLILLCATPTAAITTMFALQYNTEPKLVSSITLITTLASVGSIFGLLQLLY